LSLSLVFCGRASWPGRRQDQTRFARQTDKLSWQWRELARLDRPGHDTRQGSAGLGQPSPLLLVVSAGADAKLARSSDKGYRPHLAHQSAFQGAAGQGGLWKRIACPKIAYCCYYAIDVRYGLPSTT